jgi:chitodextrinase
MKRLTLLSGTQAQLFLKYASATYNYESTHPTERRASTVIFEIRKCNLSYTMNRLTLLIGAQAQLFLKYASATYNYESTHPNERRASTKAGTAEYAQP